MLVLSKNISPLSRFRNYSFCQRQLKIPQIAKVKFPTPTTSQGRFSVAPAGAVPSAAGVWQARRLDQPS